MLDLWHKRASWGISERFLASVAVLLFPILAQAQLQKPDQLDITDFSGGLNTYQSPLRIAPNQAQKAQNVILDQTGSVDRRQGATRVNSTNIGGGISDVNSMYQLEQSGGTKYCVAFSSTNGYYSTDACQTFTSFVSTLTRNNDVNCAPYNDNLFCVNNQYNFYFQGTASIIVSAMPANMKYIRVHRNRCWASGGSANPSRLFYSVIGNCLTWNTGTDYIDLATNDGDVITGIGQTLFDMLPIYKNYSTWALKGVDNNSFVLVNISKDTGAKNHRSIHSLGAVQLFDSLGPNGGQPGIYGFNGIVIQEMSRNVRGDLDLIDSFRSTTNRKTIDSKADWDLGTFDSRAMSSSRQIGFMQSSYTTISQSVAGDWNSGTLVDISTQDITNSVSLSSITMADSFSDGNYTSGPLIWAITGSGAVSITIGFGAYGTSDASIDLGNNLYTTGIAKSSGSWSFNHRYDGSSSRCVDSLSEAGCFDFRFMKETGGNYYSVRVTQLPSGGVKRIKIMKKVGGTTTALTSYDPGTYATNTSYSYRVERADSGVIVLYFNGVQISSTSDSDVTTSERVEIAMTYAVVSAPNITNYIGNIKYYQYKPFGVMTSMIFDTSISTPVTTIFSSTFTVQSIGNQTEINFYVRESSSPNNDMWSSLVSTSDTLRTSMTKRYQQIRSEFFTNVATNTPSISALSFSVVSTGTWRSNEIFLSNFISATGWGLFQAQQTISGAQASITYDIRIGTAVGTAAKAVPIAIVPGASITNSTGAYAIITATMTVSVTTETAKIDNIVLNWNEGTQATSASAAVFRNRYHYGAQGIAGSYNDIIYVLDTNLAWVAWTGLRPRMLNVINQELLMADSSGTTEGYINKLYSSDSDLGEPINAIYQTKDYDFGNLLHLKAIDAAYVVPQSNSGSLTLNILGDTGIRNQQFSVSMSTGASYGIRYVPTATTYNGRVFSLKFSNNAASVPWRVHRAGMIFRDLGFIQP